MDVHGTKLARTLFTIGTGVERGTVQQIVGRERRERVSHHNWSGDA